MVAGSTGAVAGIATSIPIWKVVFAVAIVGVLTIPAINEYPWYQVPETTRGKTKLVEKSNNEDKPMSSPPIYLTETATYSSSLGAPECTSGSSPCTVPQSLIQCNDNQASPGPEPNQPNTIGPLVDSSSSGTCHSDESVENFDVSVVDGQFNPSDTILISATFYMYSPADYWAICYDDNVDNGESWTLKASGQELSGAGYRTYSTSFALGSTAGRHGVRVIVKYSGAISDCSDASTSYRDTDDLAFAVVSANQPPATPTLSTPWDFQRGGPWVSTLRPEFTFSTTDANGDTLQYNIVVDDDPAFGSLNIDATSTTPTGWSGTPPYVSGASVTYTAQIDLTSGTTYWWKVRAIDPSGSNTWSSPSSSQSFTVQSGWIEQSWFQTTKEQFDRDTLSNAQTTTSGGGAVEPILSGSSWGTSTNTYSPAVEGNRLVSYNGWVINIGGYDQITTYADVKKAQVQSNGDIGAWSATTSLPAVRAYHGAVAYNGYIYVVGGSADGTSTFATTVYYATIDSNANIGTWNTATNPLYSLGWALGELAVCNGYLYTIGGVWGSLDFSNAVNYSQIGVGGQPGAWTSTTALPTVMSRISYDNLVYNGRVYVPGGYSGSGDQSFVYYASCGSGGITSWSTATNGLPATRSRHTGVMDTNAGKLYVISGVAGGAYSASVVYATINPSTGNIDSAWSSANDLPAIRRYTGSAYTSSQTSIHVVCGGDSSAIAQTSVYYLKLGAGSGSATSTTIPYANGPSAKISWNWVTWTKDTSGGGTMTVAVQKYTSSWVWTGLEGSNSVNSLSITTLGMEAQIRLVANLSGAVKLLDWDVSWYTGVNPVILSLDVRHAGTGVGDGGRLFAGHTEEFVVDVLEPQGATDVQYVDLRLDGTINYVARWTESGDTFSKQTGGTEYDLLSTGADSTSAGNIWTLTFKIKFSWALTWADNTKGPVVYVIDDESNTDLDTFAVETYLVENDLVFGGLVGWYKLNETGAASTASDSSGFGNDGSLQNGPTWTTGKMGNGLSFNGSNDRVSITDSASLDLTVFTVETWIFPTATHPTDFQPIIVKEAADGTSRNYGLFIVPNSMVVHFSFQAGDCATWRSYNAVGAMTQSAWNHIAMTYDGSNFKFYKNGVIDSNIPLVSTVCQNNEAVKLGDEVSAYADLSGTLDEVRIYNRVLSSTEISNHKNLIYEEKVRAVGQYKGVLVPGSWVSGGEQITWSGINVQYEGSGIAPLDSDFDIRITDDDTGSWDQMTGASLNLQTNADATDDPSDIHTVSVINVPSGGTAPTAKTFEIKVDATDPTAPTGVTATPPSWTSTNSFSVDWTNPADLSGIVTGAYYKLDSVPTSDTDGTWKGTKPMTGITVSGDGAHIIYVWLKDNAGNINYANRGTTTLYLDGGGPVYSGYFVWNGASWVDTSNWLSDQTPNVCVQVRAQHSGLDKASAKYYYSINGGAGWTGPTIVTGVGTTCGLNDVADGTTATVFITIDSVPFNLDSDTQNKIKFEARSKSNVLMESTATIIKIDATDPSAPTAATPTPSSWTSTNSFQVDWTIPGDLSGIVTGAYYKLDSVPTSDTDGTWVGTKPILGITVGSAGSHTIYVWLKDNAGNINYLNYATATLRYDPNPTSFATYEVQKADLSWVALTEWINDQSPDARVTISADLSGVDVSTAEYRFATDGSLDTESWQAATGVYTDLAMTIPAIDGATGTLYVKLSGIAFNQDHATNNLFQVRIAKMSAALATGLTKTVKIDTTAPLAPISPTADGSNPSPWKNTATFSISWSDPADLSGIASACYKLTTAPTSNSDGTCNQGKPFNVNAPSEGTHTVYVWLKDLVGNINYQNNATVTIRYDITSPGLPTSMTANGGSPSPWTNVNSFNIDWTNPVPPDASGIAGGYYKFSQPMNNGDGTYSGSKPISGVAAPSEGTHTLYLFLKDSAGNANYQNNNTVVLRYDATAPNAPTGVLADLSNPSPWKNVSSFSIDWTPPVGDLSGIAGWYYKMYTAPTSPTDGVYSTSKPFIAAPPTDGPLTLYLWMKDNAGNVDHTKRGTVTIRYDATPPTTISDLSSPKATGTTIRLAWSIPTEPNFLKYEVYYATHSGITLADKKWDDSNDSGLAFQTGNTTTITGLSSSATYYFRVRTIDLASNKAVLSNELTKSTGVQQTKWHLRNGANFVAVTCNPPSWTAYTLGKSITQNVTPGKAYEIMRWNAASQAWESVTSADGLTWVGTNFNIVNGGGYVVKVSGVASGGVDYTFSGSEILVPVGLTLKQGLTLSGIPFSNTSYTSYLILQKIREQNLARTVSVEIKYWDPLSDRYLTATYSNFMGSWEFSGDLFSIESERGYFIRIDLSPTTPDATFNP